MNLIGRKLFYDLTTGEIILDTGEAKGDVLPSTIEADFSSYPCLVSRNLGNTGVIQLTYGERLELNGLFKRIYVNVTTGELIIEAP